MERYEDEFMGIPGGFAEARGLDPNYRDGYGGMRMRGGNGRAAYGDHRLMRAQDLETEGGFGGIHPIRDDGYLERIAGRWEDEGGVGDPFANPRLLRDFNAHSPEYGPPRPFRYDQEMEGSQRRMRERDWSPRRAYREGYTNRGVTDAGYSEGWAYGPMRGAR